MQRNQLNEIEQQLKAVYKREFEFVEPYKGKHGEHPAEIFIDGGMINPILNTCNSIGIRDDELIISSGGMRGPYNQLIFKTNDALLKFKKQLKIDYYNSIAALKDTSVTFFKINRQSSQTYLSNDEPRPDLGYNEEDIAHTFDFEPGVITGISSGYNRITLYTRDNTVLNEIASKIKSGLTYTTFNDYDFSLDHQRNSVTISDKILADLQKAVLKHESSKLAI